MTNFDLDPHSRRIRRDGSEYAVGEIVQAAERILGDSLRIGVVIGTFAAVPYVHLQLEACKRLYPHVRMLVHDDASPHAPELAALCQNYGADFERNDSRCTPFLGDLTSFLGGLVWARENKLDLLLKLSRRFLPLTDWTASLVPLAMESQYATYCSWTRTFNFGFRSECVVMAVNEWWRLQLAQEIALEILKGGEPFVEAFIHNLARRAARFNCLAARRYDERIGQRPPDRNGYAVWAFMGTDRLERSENFLWHNWAPPEDYHAVGREWGLPYTVADYGDPNQGFGAQP